MDRGVEGISSALRRPFCSGGGGGMPAVRLLVLLGVVCGLLLPSSRVEAAGSSISRIVVEAGRGELEPIWRQSGPVWDTASGPCWRIGVTRASVAGFVNSSGTQALDLEYGDYHLFLEPGELGPNPKITVHQLDGVVRSAIFENNGAPNSSVSWRRTSGSMSIEAGWAGLSTDLVGPKDLEPSGVVDHSLSLGIESQRRGLLPLGILAFIQTVFLPGFIFVRLLRIQRRTVLTCITSFVLSLLVNYFLVIVLVVLGIYTTATMRVVFLLELMALFYLVRKETVGSAWEDIEKAAHSFHQSLRDADKTRRVGVILFTGIFLGGLAYFSMDYFSELGGIFTQWDDLVSWNRWALDWARNGFPKCTWNYPQLIPINWSISYVFVGSRDIQGLPRSIMGLFPLCVLASFYELSRRSTRYSLAFLGGSAVYLVLLYSFFTKSFIFSGYVDIAVSSVSFLSLFMVILAGWEAEARNRQMYIYLGALICAVAILIKQAGILVFIVYPLMVLTVAQGEAGSSYDKIDAKLLGKAVGLVLLIVFPWYIYKWAQIHMRLDSSEMLYVTTTIHGGKSIAERIFVAIGKIWDNSHLAVYVGVAAILVAYFHRMARKINILLVVPYIIIWMVFFSYDIRNLTLIFPFMAMNLCLGSASLFSSLRIRPGQSIQARRFLESLAVIKNVNFSFVVMIFLAIVMAFASQWTNDEIMEKTIHRRMKVFLPSINDELYRLKAEGIITGRILTNYQVLGSLPAFEEAYELNYFWTLDEVRKGIEGKGIKNIFLFSKPQPEVEELVQANLRSGNFQKVGNFPPGHTFLRILNPLAIEGESLSTTSGYTLEFLDFHPEERNDERWWRWTSGRGRIVVHAAREMNVNVRGELISLEAPNRVDVLLNGERVLVVEVGPAKSIPLMPLRIHLVAGRNVLELVSHNAPVVPPGDDRPLALAISNFDLVESQEGDYVR